MGVKNLHEHAKRLQVYSKNTSIIEFLQREEVKTTFVDTCCVFFATLFQKATIEELLAVHFREDFPDISPPKIGDYTTEEILRVIVKEIVRRARLLHASGTRVCLVIDGQPLNAKLRTIQSRKRRAIFTSDNAECHPEANVPESMQMYWLRLSDEVKGAIVQILQDIHNVPVYKANNPVDTSLFVAPFEADPQIVYLAENCQEKNCIYSHDSDLFCYPGALNSVRIIKVDRWCDPLLPGTVASSKAAFLDALNLRLPTEENYNNAEHRLLVTAAYSGNDYAQKNVPGKAFSTLVGYTRSSHGEIHSINEFADKIREKLGVAKNDPLAKKFSVAVCQFAAPTVSSVEGNRIIYNPLNYSASKRMRKLIDGAPMSSPSRVVSPHQRPSQSFQVKKNGLIGFARQIAIPKISSKKEGNANIARPYQKLVKRPFTTTGALSLEITGRPQNVYHRNHFYRNILQKLLHKVCKV